MLKFMMVGGECRRYDLKVAPSPRAAAFRERIAGTVEGIGAECTCRGAVEWYADRHHVIGHGRGNLDFVTAVTVYAVLSQDTAVAVNDKLFFEGVVSGGFAHRYGAVRDRVASALAGDIAGALRFVTNAAKIDTFAHNLYDPWCGCDRATMDRHSARVGLYGDGPGCPDCAQNMLGSKHGYRDLEWAHAAVAAELGLRAHALQAWLWVHRTECLGESVRCDHHEELARKRRERNAARRAERKAAAKAAA